MRWQEPRDESLAIVLESVRRFGKEEIESARSTHEETGLFPAELVKKMGAMGLFGLTIPEEYGGSGMGTLAASFVARELAYRWPALHLIWTANGSLAAFPIMSAGTKEQKARILPKLASGEILGCYALTEPNAGSDAASMLMRADWRKDSLTWLLNGSKIFITNALHASVAVVFARTGKKAISAFLIESPEEGLRYPGVTVRYIPKRVLKSSDFCEINCVDVLLPDSALLGREGKGFAIAMQTLDGGRINIAAQAIGMAMRIFDDAYEYTHLRQQFGRPVWENQKVQFDFARAYAELSAAWALVVEASEVRDRGESFTRLAAAAKLFATETSWRIGSDLLTCFGGMAFTQESEWLPRLLDIAPTRVYEGANNIQHMVIAKHLDD
jgi:alkylation response protein AidB-like acyl-CoA dehydrogenase